MFDQFQQAMSMMIQMFGTMHRDQMEVIRGELDQLRELTDEFHALRNELARRTQNEIGAISREPELNLAGLNQPDTVDSHDLAPPLVMPSKPKGNLEVRRVGEAPAPSPMSLSSKIIGQQLSPESDTFVTQSSASPPAPSSNSEPIVRANLQPSAKASSTGPEPDSDRATVLWLHQRIMTLQRERESRWQKVLKLVPGIFSS
jgi:hypothetical protein